MTEHFETSTKKGRGMAQALARPDRGDVRHRRGGAADHRPRRRLQAVHRRPDPFDGDAATCSASIACSRMRASGDIIPWEWIVDETRELERVSTWDDPAHTPALSRAPIAATSGTSSRIRVEVWSEKGTVRGVLAPVLDEYAVGFRVMHGFSSATVVHDIAQDDDGRDADRLYVGDFDPSGHVHVGGGPAQSARRSTAAITSR